MLERYLDNAYLPKCCYTPFSPFSHHNIYFKDHQIKLTASQNYTPIFKTACTIQIALGNNKTIPTYHKEKANSVLLLPKEVSSRSIASYIIFTLTKWSKIELPCFLLFLFLPAIILCVGTVNTNTHRIVLGFITFAYFTPYACMFDLHNQAFTSFITPPCWSQSEKILLLMTYLQQK